MMTRSRFLWVADGERGWDAESFSVEMISPRYTRIVAFPAAFTRSTQGEVIGIPMLLDFNDPGELEQHKGQLKNKILISPNTPIMDAPFVGILDEDILDRAAKETRAYVPNMIGFGSNRSSREIFREGASDGATEQEKIDQFLADEGVAALIEASAMQYDVVRVGSHGSPMAGDLRPVPLFVMSREQHGRILRMMEKRVQPTLKLHSRVKFYNEPDYHINVLADIPGTDETLSDQVLLAGAHLDTWHSGTGVGDNATGVAALMEAARILKTIGFNPRRTVRIAFWGGEEQGMKGSLGYASRHLGDVTTGKLLPNSEKISAYFNLDQGTGKLRGIYLQGNEAVRPIFDDLFKPFHYLGVSTTSILNAGGSDHLVFDALNIPSFQFMQDPQFDLTHQWHASMDVYELAVEEDIKQQAVVMASLIYHVAMRDELLPRKKTQAEPN